MVDLAGSRLRRTRIHSGHPPIGGPQRSGVARDGKCLIIVLFAIAILGLIVVASLRGQQMEAENRRIIREEVKAYLDEMIQRIREKKS